MEEQKLEKKPKVVLYVILGILIGMVLILIGYFVYKKFIVFKPKPIPFQEPYRVPTTKIAEGNFEAEKIERPKEKLFGFFNDDLVAYTIASDDCPELSGMIAPPLSFVSFIAPPNPKTCHIYLKEKPEKKITIEFK